MNLPSWRIHLTHEGGSTTVTFTGTREQADERAASYIGKPASWNASKNPPEPNMWDTYTMARIEAVEAL